MKLFSVKAITIRDGDLNGLYVTNTEEEAIERFDEEFEGYTWFYVSAEEIKEVDGYDVILKKKSEFNLNIGQIISLVKCSNCRFDIYVHPNQDKVVCEHCNTVNDLRLSI